MTFSIKTLDRLCLVAVVLIFLICGYWVVNRGIRQLRQTRQENDFLSKNLKNLALVETNLQRVNAAISETRKQMKILNERIPDSAKIGDFLKQLDALMKKREIVLESFQPLAVVEKKLFTRLPIRLILKGSFVNIYHFLHDLETMNRLVNAEQITITSLDPLNECRFDVTTSIFEH
ncbi:MAG: type 4a pilus biogenesis protein PilO [Desulfobacterales bacterium]|nr:type 4a pilus biogenesis protein PilO [Desulfobacterales bacterium]